MTSFSPPLDRSGRGQLQRETSFWPYGPGALTVIYVAIKIYYKIKHERNKTREPDSED